MMGETDEQTPVCVFRDAPHLEFAAEDATDDLYVPPEDDIYYPLLKSLYEDGE
jgi:F420-0:gamma-glutamyl ligase